MLTLNTIQEQADYVVERLRARGMQEAGAIVVAVLDLNQQRKAMLQQLEHNRSEMNRIAKLVGAEMAKGNKEAAEQAKQDTQQLKATIAAQEAQLAEVETQLDAQLVLLPNTPRQRPGPDR